MKEEEEVKDECTNLSLYNKVREVPKEAQKSIGGGRLKGMTDINPMWRIKTLTENFGLCGVGWKTIIVNKWIDKGEKNESVANVEINLFVKVEGEWSEAIVGIGGSMFVASEKLGMFTSDEAYKMAYTDAISVACKALGFGADIYWEKDKTKYDKQPEQKDPEQKYASEPPRLTWTPEAVIGAVESAKTLTDLTAAWNNSDAETQQSLKTRFTEKRKELTNA
jgi:hypothetical protein